MNEVSTELIFESKKSFLIKLRTFCQHSNAFFTVRMLNANDFLKERLLSLKSSGRGSMSLVTEELIVQNSFFDSFYPKNPCIFLKQIAIILQR